MRSGLDQTYLDTLLLYYEEEVEGEAYFAELALRFESAHHRDRLRLLADVERHAAEAVLPLIHKYGLTPRPKAELVKSGQQEAHETVADWATLTGEMRQSYPGYLEAFKALEAIGPEADRRHLSFLTEHEVAALDFLALEAHDPSRSTMPLTAYLGASPEARGPEAP